MWNYGSLMSSPTKMPKRLSLPVHHRHFAIVYQVGPVAHFLVFVNQEECCSIYLTMFT